MTSPLKVSLVNMPFADLRMPSIALAQLKSVVDDKLSSKVDVQAYYFNHDFGEMLGFQIYNFFAASNASNISGFGDWFFRQSAFPDLEDNTQSFFQRYKYRFGEARIKTYFDLLKPHRDDLDAFLDSLIDKYDLGDSDVVGLTTMFMQNVPSIALARRLKMRKPDMVVVMGGANCESPMGEELVRNVDCIDFVFSGNALNSFPDFLEHVIEGQSEELENIDGVFCRNNLHRISLVRGEAGTVVPLKPVGNEPHIDEVVEVDYDGFLDSFEGRFSRLGHEPFLLFETSRGCWWGEKAHCTFCGLNGTNMMYRSIKPDIAVDFLGGMLKKYQDRVKHYSCVDNILPRNYIEEVFGRMDIPEDVSFFYEVKADLSEEDMEAMKKARIIEVQPGIESLSTSTLKLMKKGTTAFGNVKFLQNCIKYGIQPAWNLLIGFPREEEDVYKKYAEDLPLLFHLPPPSGVFPVRFDRYSPYFTQADAYELDLAPMDFYDLVYPFPKESIATMAYYFQDKNIKAEYIRVAGKWLGKLSAVIAQWNEAWRKPGGVPPQLYFHDSRNAVIDSRNGIELKHELTPVAQAILENLAVKRKNETGLLNDLKSFDAAEVSSQLKRLKRKGFIFEERGSMLSLVLEGKTTAVFASSIH